MKKQHKIKEGETIEDYVARMAIVMDWSEEEVDIANEIANGAMAAAKIYTFNAVSELMKSISLAMAKGKDWKGVIKV